MLDFKNPIYGWLVNPLAAVAGCLGFSIGRVPGGIVLQKNPRRGARNTRRSEIPPSNFDNIALVMEHFTRCRGGAVFVQVGANDGQTSDSVHPYVRRGVLKSVLIEPIPELFWKLQDFYAGVSNVTLVNAAIGKISGEQAIYKVADQGRWKGSAWAAQLGSFDRNQLKRMGIREEEIEEVHVEVLTLPDLVLRYNLGRIDVLQIDTEGYDAEIVRCAMELKDLPECVCFEHAHFGNALPQEEVTTLYDLLAQKGYHWSHDRLNTLAVHRNFVPTGKPEVRPARENPAT